MRKIEIEILIRKVRKEKHMTISQLSKATGISQSHISDIECGKKMPTLYVICLLADGLMVDVKRLFNYKTSEI